MKQARGHVAGAWVDGQVVMRLESGRVARLPAPAPIQEHFSPGEEVTVYFDEDGRVAGWICTASGIGVICEPPVPAGDVALR